MLDHVSITVPDIAEAHEFLHSSIPLTPTNDRLPSLREAERGHVLKVLEAVAWNKKEAARVLDISRGTLYRKIEEYELAPPAVSRNETRQNGQ